MAVGTHCRQCPEWNSAQTAPTGWRTPCQTPLEIPALVFQWWSCHNTGPTWHTTQTISKGLYMQLQRRDRQWCWTLHAASACPMLLNTSATRVAMCPREACAARAVTTAYIFVVRERFRRDTGGELVLQIHQGCPVHVQEFIVVHFWKRYTASERKSCKSRKQCLLIVLTPIPTPALLRTRPHYSVNGAHASLRKICLFCGQHTIWPHRISASEHAKQATSTPRATAVFIADRRRDRWRSTMWLAIMWLNQLTCLIGPRETLHLVTCPKRSPFCAHFCPCDASLDIQYWQWVGLLRNEPDNICQWLPNTCCSASLIATGGFFSNLFSKLWGSKELRILILGLDGAGKTTILYRWAR